MFTQRVRGCLLRRTINLAVLSFIAAIAVEVRAQNYPQPAPGEQPSANSLAATPSVAAVEQGSAAAATVPAAGETSMPAAAARYGAGPVDLPGGLQFFPHAYQPVTDQQNIKLREKESDTENMGTARPKPNGSRYRSQANLRNVGEADRGSPPAGPTPSPDAQPGPDPLLKLTDVGLAGRGMPYYDTTRMNPAAMGYFLTSAIPVKTDPFFGATGRAGVQVNGTALAATLASSQIEGNQPLSATVKLENTNLDSLSDPNAVSVNITRAYVQWDMFLFGIADTAFADPTTLCNTIATLGPVGRTSVLNGVPQVAMMFLRPENPKNDPTGLYSQISLEGVAPDIATSASVTAAHDSFSRYPDLVWTLRYENDSMLNDGCVTNGGTAAKDKEENYHLQFGTVLRDISFEEAAGPPSANTLGWGVQLSGAREFYTDTCRGLRDGFYFSVTGGKGISRYFNDLHLVNATNDAVYVSSANELFLVPLVAGYLGYTHEWDGGLLQDGSKIPTNYVLTSTVAFSRIDLENPNASPLLTYRQGEELSVNVIYHMFQCSKAPNTTYASTTDQMPSPSWKDMFVGVEAAYGQRENFAGSWGDDGRIMFLFAATK